MAPFWILAGAALLAAAAALARARRVSKRLEGLRESYWELRYEIGQLQARVIRLEADRPDRTPAAPAAAVATNFVPLSSLRR